MTESTEEPQVRPIKKDDLATLMGQEWMVVEEGCGVEFLIGQKVRITKRNGVNVLMPPSFAIAPTKVSPQDNRFRGLFNRLPPAVRQIESDGSKVYCTDGVVLVSTKAAAE